MGRNRSRRAGGAGRLRAENLAAARGHRRLSIGHSLDNEPAQRLYAGLGYRDSGLPHKRVEGTIMIRGRPLDVDETIVFLVKDLPVDSGPARSS